MAVIEPRLFRLVCVLLATGLLCCATGAEAGQSDDIREELGNIAKALTAGNPADAMTPFAKSYGNYDKLRNYFIGLTNAFSIVSEVDVTDEQDSANESTVEIHWTLTLGSPGGNDSKQRAADIRARLVRQKSKWKIVDFSPIDLFDPSGNS
jgi:hypothetical protein